MKTKVSEAESTVLNKIFDASGKNASVALSKIFNTKLDGYNIQLALLPSDTIGEDIKRREEKVVVNTLRFGGEVTGNIEIAFPAKQINDLIDKKLLEEIGDHSAKLKESAVLEISNILAGAFFSTLSDYCKINILESVPRLKSKDWERFFSNYNKRKEKVMLLNITLKLKPKFNGFFVLTMDKAQSKDLINYLKIAQWKKLNKASAA